MEAALIHGFFLGLSLIVAIGAQNAFVLRQGLRGEHVFAVALVCAVSDAALIAAGVLGIGALVERVPMLAFWMTWGGAVFLIFYGALSFRSAWIGGAGLDPAADTGRGFWPTVLTVLALTWLNPHVYLDTLVLLGTIATTYGAKAGTFGLGAAIASFAFFFALAYGARVLRPIFAGAGAWRVLDVIVGLVMWAIAAKLLLG